MLVLGIRLQQLFCAYLNYLTCFKLVVSFGIVFLLIIIIGEISRIRITFSEIVLYSVYVEFVLCITLLGRQSGAIYSGMDTLFASYIRLIDNPEPYAFLEILCNIIIFIPLGMIISKFKCSQTFKHAFIVILVSSLLIESFQLIVKCGLFEVSDLIDNVIGGLIGWKIVLSSFKHYRNVKESNNGKTN